MTIKLFSLTVCLLLAGAQAAGAEDAEATVTRWIDQGNTVCVDRSNPVVASYLAGYTPDGSYQIRRLLNGVGSENAFAVFGRKNTRRGMVSTLVPGLASCIASQSRANS